MIIIEKIYVNNESSVIMINSNATPRIAQRHYGYRDCRPLRELKVENLAYMQKDSHNNKTVEYKTVNHN